MPKALYTYTGAFLGLVAVLAGGLAYAAPVTFRDENLEDAIRIAIGRNNDTLPIDTTELDDNSFTSLNASSRGITDLTGLGWCKQLRTLQLYNNNITDITELRTLSKLQDIYLWDNQIADITALTGLGYLRFVFLHNNTITDISCLEYNTSWNNGDIVNISGNYIDQYGLCNVVPALENQGVLIYKDDTAVCQQIRVNIPDPALKLQLRWALDIRDEVVNPYLYDTDLARLQFFIANDTGISDLTGLEYCVNLQLLNLEGNEISDITQIANLSFLNTLFLGGNDIEDITPLAELYSLTELGLQANLISDLTPLQALGGLVKLYLNENKITDLAKLQWLLNLKLLTLDNQNEGDPSRALTDIEPIARITGLLSLRIGGNKIADLTPLMPLLDLLELGIAKNGITDISPIQNLTDLYFLDASGNNITDIQWLDRLENIVYLYLHDNQIGPITVLAGYPDLSVVTLTNNKVTDISPLVANAGLGDAYYDLPYGPPVRDMVDVRGNTLSLENICNDIPTLRLRNVIVKTDDEQVCDPFAESYTLTMAVAVPGSGTVDPPEGSRRYVSGTRILLNATPAEGYEFSRWTGDFESTEARVEIIMDSDKRITAVFAQSSIKYTLTVEAVGNGTVVPAVGDHLYSSESRVAVTATPARGWAFSHWEGDLSGELPLQWINMDSDKLIRAVFVEQGPPQTLRIYVKGNGTTDPEPGAHSYPRDQVVSVSATPNLGYIFVRWEGDLTATAPASTTIQMTSNKSITAVFEPDEFDYTLAVGVAGGGMVEVDPVPLPADCPSCAPGYYRYHEGEVVTITAVPDTEYVFDYWHGAITSSENPATITMDSDKSVSPVFLFAPVRYELSIEAMEGGTTSPAPGAYLYGEGKKITVTAIPDQGYEFDHWEGDYAGANASQLVTMSGNIQMQAFFKPFPFISSISPNIGSTLGGTTVAIAGGRLAGATQVWFDDRLGVILGRADNELSVRTPPHDRGVATVVVVTDQGETHPLAGAFMFVEPPGPPEYGEVIPTYGRMNGGDAVLIRGQNLQLTQSVLFGGSPAQIVSSTESRLSVVTPPHAEGAVDIDIATTTGSVSGAGAFTYIPPPYISGISPSQGHISGGDAVTISGANLGQTSQVVFDAAQAAITARTPTEVVVTVPAHGAGTVDVLVITPGGVTVIEGAYNYYSVGGTIRCSVTNNTNMEPIYDATVRLDNGSSISGSVNGSRPTPSPSSQTNRPPLTSCSNARRPSPPERVNRPQNGSPQP
jgi:Leucine-rich repeat (LRR) protein